MNFLYLVMSNYYDQCICNAYKENIQIKGNYQQFQDRPALIKESNHEPTVQQQKLKPHENYKSNYMTPCIR